MKHSMIMGMLMLALSVPCHANDKPTSDSNFVVPDAATNTEQATKIRTAASLAGHYYLSGVMETGSELLLKPDGRFEWFDNYGAVVQFAIGNWSSNGTIITLTSDRVAPDSPLFSIGKQESWNIDAEDRLISIAHERHISEIEKLCPFNPSLRENVWAEVLLYAGKAAKLSARLDPKKALLKAQAALAEFERLAAMTVARGDDREVRVQAAHDALRNWSVAKANMNKAFKKAGQPFPQMNEPKLPKQCEISEKRRANSIPEAEWQRGILIIVGDFVLQRKVSGVLVRLIFSDGHTEDLLTDAGGWAIAPMRPGSAVDKISFTRIFPFERSQTLTVRPFESGAQSVNMDLRQINGTPFATLKLTIDGKALVPEGLGRGRYEK